MCKVVLRRSGSNGVVCVELKQNLTQKFPVLSQQTRCEKIHAVLYYLETHNHLYEYINIMLSAVSAEEINNENNFPIDFKCQQIWTKNESIEQVILYFQ